MAASGHTSAPERSGSLWEEALKNLTAENTTTFDVHGANKLEILQSILAVAEQRRDMCLQKRLKYTRGGQVIILRDQLDKIIAWVGRFKEISSTLVQYDPVHAAVPWAAVLAILQCATSDIQTFGAMVDGVERISGIMPRYAILEEAYLRKRPLSAAQQHLEVTLVKLYTTILRYLVKARRYFSTGTARRVVSSALGSSETQVQRLLDIVSKKAADVDSCLLVIQSEANHSIDNQAVGIFQLLSGLEKPIVRASVEISQLYRRFTIRERTRLLSWLSPIRSSLHHRSEREGYLPGSGSWLFKKPEFVRWSESPSSALLWLHGIPGCGKTKLICRTIQKLIEEMQSSPNPAPIAYFYCARNSAEPERSNPDMVVRSLLRQLATSARGEIKDLIVEEYQRQDEEAQAEGGEIAPLTLSQTKSLIFALLDRDPATIIIDALDECDPTRRHELLSILDEIIMKSSNVVKVMVASRDDGDIFNRLINSPNVYIRADENGADIERFIDYSISKAVSDCRLLNGQLSEETKAEVSMTLKEKAQGMFRWVTMQIDNLCDNARIKLESDVQHEIGILPKTLRETFDRSYQRVLDLARPSRLVAERVIKWLLCAQRLMDADTLAAAVTFASEHHVLTTQNILDICCNMVVVDELGHFRFAHLSVREYLESLDVYSATECHALVLRRCLEAYLNTSTDWTSRLHSHLDTQLRSYTMTYWPLHCQQSEGLREDKALAMTLNAFIFDEKPLHDGISGQKSILSPAFIDWADDVLNASQYSGAGEREVEVVGVLKSVASLSPSPQFVACVFDLVWILDEMRDRGWTYWNSVNHEGESCISLAVRWGSTRAMNWILQEGHATHEPMAEALFVSLEQSKTEVAVQLIENGADGFFHPSDGVSALVNAVHLGHMDVVLAILRRDLHFTPYEFYIDSIDIRKVYRLYKLLGESFENLVVLKGGTIAIIKYNNARQSMYSLLLWAHLEDMESMEEGDWIEAAEIILSLAGLSTTGIEEGMNEDDEQNLELGPETWLYKAIGGRNNIPEHQSRRLQFAQLLVNMGVDVNKAQTGGRTPLIMAVKAGDLAMIEFLVSQGAKLEHIDGKGRTVLIHAVKENNQDAVSLLVRLGSDVNRAPFQGGPAPLKVAIDNCQHEMISHLRRNGARRPGFATSSHGISIPYVGSKSCKYCVARLLRNTPTGQDIQSGIQVVFDHMTSPLITTASSDENTNNVVADLDTKLVHPDIKSWEDGLTPLQAATCLRYPGVAIESLLQVPVDVNAKDNHGFSVLHYACSSSLDTVAIKLMLSYGADPTTQDCNGCTPLHFTAYLRRSGSVEVCEMLLKANSSGRLVGIHDCNGNTALHLAVMSGNKQVFKTLLAEGADAHVRSNNGDSCIELARALWNTNLENVLESGADVFSDAYRCLLGESNPANDADVFPHGQNNTIDSHNHRGTDTKYSDHCDEKAAGTSTNINSAVARYRQDKHIHRTRETNLIHLEEQKLITVVDHYNAYDAEMWSPLAGQESQPLRPVDAIYRGGIVG